MSDRQVTAGYNAGYNAEKHVLAHGIQSVYGGQVRADKQPVKQ